MTACPLPLTWDAERMNFLFDEYSLSRSRGQQGVTEAWAIRKETFQRVSILMKWNIEILPPNPSTTRHAANISDSGLGVQVFVYVYMVSRGYLRFVLVSLGFKGWFTIEFWIFRKTFPQPNLRRAFTSTRKWPQVSQSRPIKVCHLASQEDPPCIAVFGSANGPFARER